MVDAVEASTVTYRVLSLGAGVQSSVLALLLARDDSKLRDLGYPQPDEAVFADTGWEPDYVYQHLAWLEGQLPYPVNRVSAGDLRANLRRGQTPSGHRFVDVPFYVTKEDGKRGMLWRQCTNHYKIRPITRAIRESAGGRRRRPFPKGRHVEMWLGISSDEHARMKPSREPWVEHRWPLIDRGMSRQDCLDWFASEYPDRLLPRSACVICPYRSDKHWIELKETDPGGFREAVEFDRWLRRSTHNPVRRVVDGRPYLHKSCRPLGTVVAEMEQKGMSETDDFTNECEGLCGV